MGYQVMNKIEMEPSGLSETYFHTMMRLMGENRDIMELEADLGVCILGGGHAGMCAAQTAEGLGAEVVVFDVNIQRLEYLRTVLKNTDLRFMSKTAFAEEVAKADVLINCIYAYPGMEVPIVTRDMVRSMRKGSVIVDLEGEGIIETSQYTTISNPYFVEDGIVHVGITNIPAMVPTAANESYGAYVFPLVQDIAKYGIKEACKKNYVLRSCVAMVNGKITQKEVADSQHCEYTPLDPDTMF
jgi:alanine dehydrogenase